MSSLPPVDFMIRTFNTDAGGWEYKKAEEPRERYVDQVNVWDRVKESWSICLLKLQEEGDDRTLILAFAGPNNAKKELRRRNLYMVKLGLTFKNLKKEIGAHESVKEVVRSELIRCGLLVPSEIVVKKEG